MKKLLIVFVCITMVLILGENLQWTSRLNQAIFEDNQNKVSKLLEEEGHNVDKKSGWILNILLGDELRAMNPLEAAVYSRNYNYIEPLLQYGANPNAIEMNPITYILEDMEPSNYREKEYIIDLLLKHGFDVDHDFNDGEVTLCSIAGENVVNSYTGKEDDEYSEYILNMYKRIISICNQKKPVDDEGNTPLHYAIAYGRNMDLIKYLIEECDYTLHEVNKSGETPLLYALNSQSFYYESDLCNMDKIIELCIENEYDFLLKDADGYSAYDYIKELESSGKMGQIL